VKAVILAGGLGTRLQPYTFFIPKPMLPLGNKPLLEYLVEWLIKSKKINEIIICVSYLHRSIEDYFEDGTRFGINIKYSRSDRPLATAGQLKTAAAHLKEPFVCLYGDSVYEFPLDKMIENHFEDKAFISMALSRYKTNLKYGFIELSDTKKMLVSEWKEKPEISGLINIGCYVFEPEFLDLIPISTSFGMDEAVRESMKSKKKVKSFIVEEGSFMDIGDKKSYLEAYKLYVKKLGKI
jgi:mannose-1-phosphate guanylyltransferase